MPGSGRRRPTRGAAPPLTDITPRRQLYAPPSRAQGPLGSPHSPRTRGDGKLGRGGGARPGTGRTPGPGTAATGRENRESQESPADAEWALTGRAGRHILRSVWRSEGAPARVWLSGTRGSVKAPASQAVEQYGRTAGKAPSVHFRQTGPTPVRRSGERGRCRRGRLIAHTPKGGSQSEAGPFQTTTKGPGISRSLLFSPAGGGVPAQRHRTVTDRTARRFSSRTHRIVTLSPGFTSLNSLAFPPNVV